MTQIDADEEGLKTILNVLIPLRFICVNLRHLRIDFFDPSQSIGSSEVHQSGGNRISITLGGSTSESIADNRPHFSQVPIVR
jgi:hypothetical protein